MINGETGFLRRILLQALGVVALSADAVFGACAGEVKLEGLGVSPQFDQFIVKFSDRSTLNRHSM